MHVGKCVDVVLSEKLVVREWHAPRMPLRWARARWRHAGSVTRALAVGLGAAAHQEPACGLSKRVRFTYTISGSGVSVVPQTFSNGETIASGVRFGVGRMIF